MELENLKARYYMLLGQAEEAKNIYLQAVNEMKQQEAKKNANPEKQSDQPTATTTETVNQ